MCDETIASWNEWAALYTEQFLDMPMYHGSYDAFLTILRSTVESAFSHNSSVSVLDIGCGPGIIAKYILESHEKFQIPSLHFTGIDAAPKMIESAKQYFSHQNTEWRVVHSRNLRQSFEASQFMGIFLGFCAPYIPSTDLIDLLADISLLLLPNGILYVSFVVGDHALSGWKSNKKGQRVMFYYYEENDMKEWLLAANFQVQQVLHINFPRPSEARDEDHCIIIAQKPA